MKPSTILEKSWKMHLHHYTKTSNFNKLNAFIKSEYSTKTIYPAPEKILKCFNLTCFDDVRVVILGQDPYHGAGQAQGLSFSVPTGMKLPPSLQNIFKEVEKDLGIKKDFTDGDLTVWAAQGVLLLNSILTVEESLPGSHKNKGWEDFTDAVIKTISNKKENVVFMLWGNYAQTKEILIDSHKHLILKSPHPSPFSAHSGFFDSKPFSTCNTYLEKNNLQKILW